MSGYFGNRRAEENEDEMGSTQIVTCHRDCEAIPIGPEDDLDLEKAEETLI